MASRIIANALRKRWPVCAPYWRQHHLFAEHTAPFLEFFLVDLAARKSLPKNVKRCPARDRVVR